MTRDEMIAHLVLLGCYPISTDYGYTWVGFPSDWVPQSCRVAEWGNVRDDNINQSCAELGVCDDG